jgi:hypothetical protein
MIKIHCQILILVLLFSNAYASGKGYITGGHKKTYLEAERFLNNENYDDALPLFLQLDSLDKDNANLKFKVGFCYLNSSANRINAIPYLLAASKNISENYKKNDLKEKQAPKYALKYLAKAYQLNYEFDKAIETYLKYKETLGTSRKLTAEVEDILHGIETCTNGIDLLKTPKHVKILNLGEGVNSKYADYSSVISHDNKVLMFTSRRPIGKGDIKNSKGLFDEDIYSAELGTDNKWKNIKLIEGEINTTGNQRVVNTTFDGSLIICKDDGNDENLYLSALVNGEWKSPQYWGSGVNGVADETSASITNDGRILYFVSNREGGFGGSDIYKCIKLPNGKWGPAQNLGATINTKYDEDGVFVNPNGREIFFSSQGYKSMGGYDIFSSIIDPENGFLSVPLSVGYPINTTGDDLFFKIDKDGKTAYLSSDRTYGLGSMDIYQVSYPEESEKRDITLIVGRIINNSKEDLSDNLILVIDKATHEIIQEIEANNATGKFGIDLPTGSTYDIQYFIKGKEIYKETIDVKNGNGYQVILREIPYGN